MKIRAGFVSNSSSTSFLIISKKDLNKADFFELMGIDLDSPIADLFSGFYEAVVQSVRVEADFKTGDKDLSPESLFHVASGRLSEHMLAKVADAKKRGLKAFYGSLDSETSPIETFFCTDSFEVENDKIYFNGLENAW
jgi:hypothetical protein